MKYGGSGNNLEEREQGKKKLWPVQLTSERVANSYKQCGGEVEHHVSP